MLTTICFLILFAVADPKVVSTEELPAKAAEEQIAPVAMEGYCLVTLVDLKKWVRGKPEFSCTREGVTYHFASEASRKKFLADEKYRQALFAKGLDIASLKPVPGKREHGIIYKGQVYLFENEETLRKFSQNPELYIQKPKKPTKEQKPVVRKQAVENSPPMANDSSPKNLEK
jgi:YHS domain-containing protein